MEEPMKRKVRNRRLSEDEEMGMGWRVMYSMGMPLLYICAVLLGIVAIICNGIVAKYWSDLSPPMCYLYSTTPSQSLLFYKFGGSLSSCQWVTYGGVTSLIFLVLGGIIYFAAVRGTGKLTLPLFILEILSLLGTLLMLAVTCTLTEGLRQTCVSMGLNQLNMRGENCHSLLNLRVSNYNLSVSSSTLIRGALFTFWPCTVLMFIITIIHLCSCYRRCYR
ncbi:uncharacterized protein LOC135207889 [Macrobrachium nipponense]|uniref:uncharacterized protein LOC135207889 n=1 Tax=Macrobrachium nipponense TaxID=159736 RepID=UPI0030C816A9